MPHFLRPSQPERIDVLAPLDELPRGSFVDEHISPKDGISFVGVPLVASLFGKKQLSISSQRTAVEEDTRFLQKFGAVQLSDVQKGFEPRIRRFPASLSDELAQGKIRLAEETPVLELIARG
jgi:hypothetical protein